ncbi:MAG TPA: lipopolysaccharide biosynthesis protein [Rhodospirillaceae bacterium]|jgi:capsular polysaccharide transport system permease protein|nr:lipopolysaccharide biosynthesis protein [Alphaproteobacteria bacterium]HBH26450.1 lipopolysaccharide biosynthesis protein [Rhodospirillaceae bacterium]
MVADRLRPLIARTQGLAARAIDRLRPLIARVQGLAASAVARLRALRPHDWRRAALGLSFALFVGLPTAGAVLYYGLMAADRYAAGAGFAVRGMGHAGAGGGDMIQSFTGLASGSTTISDSYIVLKYLRSRDMLERLAEDYDLQSAYAHKGDIFARLPRNATPEELVKYWDTRVKTSFDIISGIMTFEVQAFAPEDAQAIAALVLDYTKDLVNTLSESARQDSVRFAREEVARAEERLRTALESVRTFRNTERSIDPAASAKMEAELLTGLEKELTDVRARMAALSGGVGENAPSMVALKRQASALEAQIERRAAGISATTEGGGTALSEQLAAYEALEVERTFAQQAYASALSSLEAARMEADAQQRYLALYASPKVPQEAAYPLRVVNIALILAVSFCLWAIGTLVAYAVRDHLS